MTNRAQEVRANRIAMINQDVNDEAKKVFDWALKLIEEDTKEKCFKDFVIYLFNDESKLRTDAINGYGKEYNLNDFLYRHDRIKLFEALKEIVESEEGFSADFKPTKVWDSPCILFKIIIK